MLAACGGSSSSGDVPEIDAVAETWEEQGPQFRKDICDDDLTYLGPQVLAEATLEAYPNSFLDDDVEAAAGWFLKSWGPYSEDMPVEEFREIELALELDRGLYLNAQYMDETEARLPVAWANTMEELESPDGLAYLGPLDPTPNPCAD